MEVFEHFKYYYTDAINKAIYLCDKIFRKREFFECIFIIL